MPFGLVCQNVFGTDWRSVFYQYFFEKLNKIKVHAKLLSTCLKQIVQNYRKIIDRNGLVVLNMFKS